MDSIITGGFKIDPTKLAAAKAAQAEPARTEQDELLDAVRLRLQQGFPKAAHVAAQELATSIRLRYGLS